MLFREHSFSIVVILILAIAGLAVLLPMITPAHAASGVNFSGSGIALQSGQGVNGLATLKPGAELQCQCGWRFDATCTSNSSGHGLGCNGLGGCGAICHALIMTPHASHKFWSFVAWRAEDVAMLIGVRPPGDEKPPRG